jgi:hypothetical protein
MYRPPLPAKMSPNHACRPERGLTAFAPLSVEQFPLRSSPGWSLTTGRWWRSDRHLRELPDRGFQSKNTTDETTAEQVRFTHNVTSAFTSGFTPGQQRSAEHKTRSARKELVGGTRPKPG